MTGRKRLLLLVSLVALVAIAPGVALADAARPVLQRLRDEHRRLVQLRWRNDPSRTVRIHEQRLREGIPSASGSWHARLGKDKPLDVPIRRRTAACVHGPTTNWGGYSSIFPTGGYTTRVDIYLDTQWAATHPDQRFDWSSAIDDTSGQHRRDFVFNVGTEPLGFVISGSNNATRCGATPADPGRTPVPVTISGWYTFEHVFTVLPVARSPSRCG